MNGATRITDKLATARFRIVDKEAATGEPWLPGYRIRERERFDANKNDFYLRQLGRAQAAWEAREGCKSTRRKRERAFISILFFLGLEFVKGDF
jgi:hypothetical protein